jgi:biotin/methionine sulfoxide reductase
MSKATEPPGQARNDYDIFSGIAREMGVEAEFTEGRSETGWLEWIYETTLQRASESGIDMPGYEKLKRDGWFAPTPPEEPVVLLKAFRDDPEANPLRTPSGKIEIFSANVASFGYHDCPGHAFWMEPLEWLGQENRKFDLHLISSQPKTKLHSQLDHGKVSRNAKIKGREPVSMCRLEAKKRNLGDGDIVRIYNDRGACLAALVVDDNIMPGVAQMCTGAWYDPLEPGTPGTLCKHGNPNILTPDKGTSSLGQGPIAHTCLVEIVKFDGDPPPVTAFEPPQILPGPD